jgi:propionyl-CoA synthetase
VPVIDHWWQTETGWPICANCLGIESCPLFPAPRPGPYRATRCVVLDDNGEPIDDGSIGALAIRSPLPPGTFTTLWNADERFEQAYFARFPGYYETGDAGYIDDNGYVFVMARTDDVINVAGHRLSTGAMEEVLAAHPDVAECAVIGVSDALKGQLPVGLLVLSDGVDAISRRSPRRWSRRCANRSAGGRLSRVPRGAAAAENPLRQDSPRDHAHIADGRDYRVPATIDDPVILEEMSALLKR